MIQFQNLSKIFADGTKALDQINLNFTKGEFVAVIGRSGSGKSTLLRHVNGLLTPTSGRVVLFDQDLTSVSSNQLRLLRRRVGFIFQQFNLIRGLTVLENVLVGRLGFHKDWQGCLGLFDSKESELAVGILRNLGLGDKVNAIVDQLSGGQQQRVAIARTFVQQPEIILADEPLASLDPKLSTEIIDLLTRENEKNGQTILINIHSLEIARKFGKRIVALKAGRVVFDGKASELTDSLEREVFSE